MLDRIQKLDRLERRTVLMGAIALTTVGAVVAGEVAKLWRRRVVAEEPETTPEVIQKGARAALDTVEVARRGYREAPAGESALFNLLISFVISSSLVRLTTLGVRRGVPLLFNVRIGSCSRSPPAARRCSRAIRRHGRRSPSRSESAWA
jgi:hypothetical protein